MIAVFTSGYLEVHPNQEPEMYCKTCKYWDRYTQDQGSDYYGPFAGMCNSKKFVYNETPVLLDGLMYEDYKGYAAGFSTGQDFGCIHWESKA